jgi:hypothetical protein
LIQNFVDDVGIEGPLSNKDIEACILATHISSGLYLVSKDQVQDYLCGLARWWVEGFFDDTDIILQEQLALLLPVIESIKSACFCHQENSPFVEQHSLPPVLPKELVRTCPTAFPPH